MISIQDDENKESITEINFVYFGNSRKKLLGGTPMTRTLKVSGCFGATGFKLLFFSINN